MLLGPNHIYECPKCRNFITVESIMSGNTMGAVFYSDGKHLAPMLPEFPDLTRCNNCHNFLWLHKLKAIGEYYPGEDIMAEWKNAQEARFLNIDEYFEALAAGVTKSEADDRFIRQKIWQGYNDRIRQKKRMFKNREDKNRWKSNIEKLIDLLSPADADQKLMLAELYRNLGQFRKSLRILKTIKDTDLAKQKKQLTRACLRRKRRVVELK